MARLYSNELKAIVVPENFLDNPKNVLKDHCLRVQHFNYECEHNRNEAGEVYGPTKSVILRFTVRVNSPSQVSEFYKNLMVNADFNYSFLFNATFDANQRLYEYEDGMVVNGYVISIEELFNSEVNAQGESEQIQMNIEVLARSVTYLGSHEQNNYNCEFVK